MLLFKEKMTLVQGVSEKKCVSSKYAPNRLFIRSNVAGVNLTKLSASYQIVEHGYIKSFKGKFVNTS